MTDEFKNEPRSYPGEKAHQGEIILRKRWQRIVFIAGLGGMVMLAVLMGLAPYL